MTVVGKWKISLPNSVAKENNQRNIWKKYKFCQRKQRTSRTCCHRRGGEAGWV